ncbi:MAG: DUF421 domain-containing protein, partial [Clostridia bacterium]|nr:DUF421 domain-containing protein [Clostridia bacterium]
FDLSELQERLREKDIFSLQDVDYVILETNGEISVILKPEKNKPTLKDLNITPVKTGVSYNLVLDGRIMEDNIKQIGKNKTWLNKQLKKYKAKPKEILIATIDESGNFFCQKKD